MVPELECKSRKSVHESTNEVARRAMASRRSITCKLRWECNLATEGTAAAQRGRDTGAGYDNDSQLALLQPLSGSERAGSECLPSECE